MLPVFECKEMYNNIEKLSEEIEDLERATVFSASDQDNTKENQIPLYKENNTSEEIEAILKDGTIKIQNLFKAVGKLDEEDVQCLVLEVIKKYARNDSLVSLSQAVDEEIQETIKKLRSSQCKKDILTKVLIKDGKDIASNIIKTDGNIEEIIKLISENLLTNEEKDKLLMDYKTIEFLTLQSLIFNTGNNTSDNTIERSIEDISSKSQNNQNLNIQENVRSTDYLKEECIQSCYEKIHTILDALNILANKFGFNSSLNNLIKSMIDGLENFSCDTHNRHIFYDQILFHLDAYIMPKSGSSKTENIDTLKTELEKLKQKIITEQWELFVQKQQKEIKESSEGKFILRVVEAQCESRDANLNIQELEYHIDNMIKLGKLCSQNIYLTINNIRDIAYSGVAESNREIINRLRAFLLIKADEVELEKISKLFKDRINYQEKQYKFILEMKSSIIEQYKKYCGILHKKNKDNYTKMIKVYLDKIDRLVAATNAEDISYSRRKDVFSTLKVKVINIVEEPARQNFDIAEYIENEISETLNTLIFSTIDASSNKILSTDILEHIKEIIDGALEEHNHYKRENKTVQTINLDDLFDNTGRVKEKEKQEVFSNNKTVIVNIDQEEYYRLSEDLYSLKRNPETYAKSINEYGQELFIKYKRYKLVQLKNALDTYKSNKNLKNFINVTEGFIFYLSLREEHLQDKAGKTFQHSVHQFVINYHSTVENLMINDKCHQAIISQLRIAIDLFNEDVMKIRKTDYREEDTCLTRSSNTELMSNLIVLRNTLTYHTYKESGFHLFAEVENRFTEQLARNNLLQEELNIMTERNLPEIIWLRSILTLRSSEKFFKSLNKLISIHLPKELVKTSNDSIIKIQTFINKQKNYILLYGLVDEELLNIEDFIEKIKTKELTWKIFFSNLTVLNQHTITKLHIILQEHNKKFSKEDFEEVIFELSKKETNVDYESFLTSLLNLYAKKIISDQNESLKKIIPTEHITVLLEALKAAIANAFNVWYIDRNAKRKKSCKKFIEHLKQLVMCTTKTPFLDDDVKIIEKNLEQAEIRFITDILNISELDMRKPVSSPSSVFPYLNFLNNSELNRKANIISTKLGEQKTDEDKITYLKLLLLLPNGFYNNREDYRTFIANLVENMPKITNEQSDVQLEINYYIREHICRYYKLFLYKILNITEESEDTVTLRKQVRSDILEALSRLYNNISVTGFIMYSIKWLGIEDKKVINSIIEICEGEEKNKIINDILKFLYREEKEHLKALLSFGDTTLKVACDNSTGEETDKIIDAEINKLLEKHRKQSTTDIMSKLNEIFNARNGISIIMWRERLINLRLNTVRNFILKFFKNTQDHGTTKISDILDALRFFAEENGNVSEALNTLDIIYNNIDKFSTLEEIKHCLYSLLYLDDLNEINHIIKSGNKRNVTLDLLFNQIDVGDNKKIKNAIDKLKLILSTRAFAEIIGFCKIFILKLRDQQNLDNLSIIIDLILRSETYIRTDILTDLQEKEFSLWVNFLEKAIILMKLNTTIFNECRNEEKNKVVGILYQIKEEKGENLQKTLLENITNLDKNALCSINIKKLIFILNRIMYKSYKHDAINNLSKNLNEWETELFSDSELRTGKILTPKQLLILMQEPSKINSDGINASIKFCLKTNALEKDSLIEKVLSNARNLTKKSKIHVESNKTINIWHEDDIKEWARKFKKRSFKDSNILSWSTTKSSDTIEILIEVISVIIQAVTIYDHYPLGPRDTQLISLLLFLDSNKSGRLGNVYTGEGKTLITVMLATCLGLMCKRIDIVTSSKVLAIRDSKIRHSGTKEGYAGFYKMFDLNASNNCDEECEKQDTGEEERRNRYANCNILYGETSYFQRDILLSQFFKKNIRGGSGIGDVLILDEVDSMMIDNAAKTLYISHNITDMRYLRDIFIHIWAAVNSCEKCYSRKENVDKVAEFMNKIIDVNNDVGSSEESNFKVQVPKTLYDFVQLNLQTWIESAYDAKYMGEDNDYIIGDWESQKQNEVIIMDKDTGVEQTSSKWGNGLHQFIQLKHSGKLSDESLKAVYISNACYFQSYHHLYGMTGTVGGTEERRLLNDVYDIDFFEIPRFKTYQFEYDFESESVAGTSEEWLQNIVENIDENMDQELTYTIEYTELMRNKFQAEKTALESKKKLHKEHCDKKLDHEQKQKQYEQNIEVLKEVEEKSNKIVAILENQAFGQSNIVKIRKISDDIDTIHKLCTDKCLSDKVEKLLHFIIDNSNDCENHVIEQCYTDFKNITKIIIGLHNQEKDKLKKLDILIKKIEEEIDHIAVEREKIRVNVAFYDTESKASPGNQKPDSRRAILIICDSISDLSHIEQRIRTRFNNPKKNKIYKYDRAYKKFDVSCLEAGDIIVATNIAGRGTDLEVSKQVEENGGLHVILSYMPKNFRIEQQAFGRTARSGNRGTATYIVLDPTKQFKDIDISQLKEERNAREATRLKNIEINQLPIIKLEDTLFIEFNKLQQKVEDTLKLKKRFIIWQKYSKKQLQLQLDSLKNKWAFWLNKMSDEFNKVYEKGDDTILREYEVFEREVYNKLDNKYELIEEPGEINKLGHAYLDNEQYSEALDCFNYIIEQHSTFASIAYYYKALCIIRTEGGGYDAKLKVKEALKQSLKLLENDRTRILSRNQILKSINQFTRAQGQGLYSNCFDKQNEGEAHILSIHINAIKSAVGSEVHSDYFNTPGIEGDLSQKVFDALLEKDIVKGFRISKKCFIGSKVLIKDQAQQKHKLEHQKDILKPCIQSRLNEDYITYDNEDYKSETLRILTDAGIISDRQIFKKVKETYGKVTKAELILFPNAFDYCKEQVLKEVMDSLNCSQKNKWCYKSREKTSSSFESVIYTTQKFVEDTVDLIEIEEKIEIAADINKNILGKLDHAVFCGKGDQIKKILLENSHINTNNSILKHKLNEIIKNETSLTTKQISEILTHLETYTKLNVDHAFLERRFIGVENEEIFLGKKNEIKEFCLGRRKISLQDGNIIELFDHQTFAKDDIISALALISLSKDSSSEDKMNFDALLIHLGFDCGEKLAAINSYNQYALKNDAHMAKIKEYLEVVTLKDSNANEKTINNIDQLDLSVDSRLTEKSSNIKDILRTHLSKNKPLKKEDFLLAEEEFNILRGILIDSNIITTSIFNLLTGRKEENRTNFELETILMRMYEENGVITDRDIVLKDAKNGSQELFNRMIELQIIKPPKINFPLGRAANIPTFVGGNYWKESSDPVKKLEYIKCRVEEVVLDVFKLDRQKDITESNNKKLDEKIEILMNIIKHVSWTIKTLPEIKIELKDLRTMFSNGTVPPELMDYISICFDGVLEYKESKGFDWDCFLCGVIGLAQIVAGAAFEVTSGFSGHCIASTLIAEGVGDLVFAITAGVRNDFTWESYAQHKVQSLTVSLLTAGVGSFLSKGAQASKLCGVGLATKREIMKAIMKTSIVEVCTAVVTATINIGTEEISKLLIEEVTNNNFVKYFENWTKSNLHKEKVVSIENKLNTLYNKFDTNIAKQSISTCIETSLNNLISGALGNKIFSQISNIAGSVTKGFSMAANRLGKGNSKAELLAQIAHCVDTSVKVTEFSKKFLDLCNICNDFYDHLNGELTKLDDRISEQQKLQTKIAKSKDYCSSSGEASKDLKDIEEKMHIAFKKKIKYSFLDPAVSLILHTAINPIQQIITAPFVNARKQLEEHIGFRAKKLVTDLLNQPAGTMKDITTKQKRALEERGDIIKLQDIEDPSFKKLPVENVEGYTLQKLEQEYGPNVSILIKDNKIYAVHPSFDEYCNNIKNGVHKNTGLVIIKTAATLEERNIEIVDITSDGSKKLIEYQKGPGIVSPITNNTSTNESYKLAYIEGDDDDVGHFAPVIKDENGKWKVITVIEQNSSTKDACFGQCMAFLREYNKSGNIDIAKAHAEDSNIVLNYYNSLGKNANYNKEIKTYYLQGTTIKSNRIVGGKIGSPRKKLKDLGESNYPSYNYRIKAPEKMSFSHLAFQALLFEEQEKYKNFNFPRKAAKVLKFNITPGFGSNPDKEGMMIGVMSVRFDNGTTFQRITVSGNEPFYTRQKATLNDQFTRMTMEPRDFSYTDSWGYTFADPGRPEGPVYNVIDRVDTPQEHLTSCAAAKCFVLLERHMKVNPHLKIAGDIHMSESWYNGKINVKYKASCSHCEKVLPMATGKDYNEYKRNF